MKIQRFKYLLLGLCLDSVSYAAPQDLISCTSNSGFSKTGCSVKEVALAESPKDSLGLAFEADFIVEFLYPCSSNNVSFGLLSGETFQKFPGGKSQQSVTINGSDSLKTFDPNPTQSFLATLGTQCDLDIISVSLKPTSDQIRNWYGDAVAQAKIVDLTLEKYQLAVDFDHYSEWSKERTQLMLDGIKKKIGSFEARCNEGSSDACTFVAHLKTIETVVSSHLSELPSLANVEGTDLQKLQEAFRIELDEEVALATKMQARFKEYSALESAELIKALESAKLEVAQ